MADNAASAPSLVQEPPLRTSRTAASRPFCATTWGFAPGAVASARSCLVCSSWRLICAMSQVRVPFSAGTTALPAIAASRAWSSLTASFSLSAVRAASKIFCAWFAASAAVFAAAVAAFACSVASLAASAA